LGAERFAQQLTHCTGCRSPSLAIVLVLMSRARWYDAARQQALVLAAPRWTRSRKLGAKWLYGVRSNGLPDFDRYAPLIQELSAKYAHEAAVWLVLSRQNRVPKISAHTCTNTVTATCTRDAEHAWVEKSRVEVTPEAAVFNTKRELVYHGRIDNSIRTLAKARRAAKLMNWPCDEAARKGGVPRTAWWTGLDVSSRT